MDKNGYILSTGYNGLLPKMEYPEWMTKERHRTLKAVFTIHAEKNAFSTIKRGECDTLFLTHSPCKDCAQMIASYLVKKVFFIEKYKKCDKYIQIFHFYGISHYSLDQLTKSEVSDRCKKILNSIE